MPMRPPMGHPRERQRQRDQARPNVAVRRLYNTVRWAHLRQAVLLDQAYACARCGMVQVDLEVHHQLKAAEHPDRFFDRTILEALCPACHTAATMRGE